MNRFTAWLQFAICVGAQPVIINQFGLFANRTGRHNLTISGEPGANALSLNPDWDNTVAATGNGTPPQKQGCT